MKGTLTEIDEPFVESDSLTTTTKKLLAESLLVVNLKKQFYKIIFNQELYFLSMDVTEFGGK